MTNSVEIPMIGNIILPSEINKHDYPFVVEVHVPKACTYRFGYMDYIRARHAASRFCQISVLRVTIRDIVADRTIVFKLK